MKKVLFISHNPHKCHLAFAKAMGARIKIIPTNKLVELTWKFRFLSYFYPIISFLYGLFLRCFEDIILVDGGSSFWVALALKFKKPSLKIIYLDGDAFFYFLMPYYKNPLLKFFIQKIIFNNISLIISVSEQNREIAKKYFKGSIILIHAWPKRIVYQKVEKRNYGLYVGRLSPKDKKIDRIINFALQCPYLERMIIVGDGIFKREIKKIAQRSSKIIYIGKVKDPSFYYSQCKFLIHLAKFDPLPITVLEAVMADCIPIVSKNVGAKVFLDPIFVIDQPDDFDEVNKRIRYILENEKLIREKLNETKKKIPQEKEEIEKLLKNLKNQSLFKTL